MKLQHIIHYHQIRTKLLKYNKRRTCYDKDYIKLTEDWINKNGLN